MYPNYPEPNRPGSGTISRPESGTTVPVYPYRTCIRNYPDLNPEYPEMYLPKEKEGGCNKYMYFIYFFTASYITSTYMYYD